MTFIVFICLLLVVMYYISTTYVYNGDDIEGKTAIARFLIGLLRALFG